MDKVTRHEKILWNFFSLSLSSTIDMRIECERDDNDDDDLQLSYLIDCLFFSLANCCYFCRHYFLFLLRPDRSNWQSQKERKTPDRSCSDKHNISETRNQSRLLLERYRKSSNSFNVLHQVSQMDKTKSRLENDYLIYLQSLMM